MKKLNIAVVGSGISGLSCAWLLSKEHHVSIFEKNGYFGGHSNTKSIITKVDNKNISVDTGFIVFNNKNYPNLESFFKYLGVKTYKTDMSFGVSMQNGSFEYSGKSLKSLFSNKNNWIKPEFWIMLKDIIGFYRNAEKDSMEYQGFTIDNYLNEKNYSKSFKYFHLYPMAASIWSAPINKIKQYPFNNFISFFKNHGLLNFLNRPKWETVLNGSRQYVEKIFKSSKIKQRLKENVESIKRTNNKVFLKLKGKIESFDHVILAVHSDQALKMIDDIDEQEKKALKFIKYQKNTVFLHSDQRYMPKNKSLWSSWNYVENDLTEGSKYLTVSYWMNNLQQLKTQEQIFVSLNLPRTPLKQNLYETIEYSHPMFDNDTIIGQQIIKKNQGNKNTWFCGAYLGYGFHEDGIKSGIEVAEKLSRYKKPW